jgi:hypothetical protein
MSDPYWRGRAECANHPPEVWFPRVRPGVAANYDPKVRAAQAICATCTVQRECAAEALNGTWRNGIWAGVYISPSTHAEVRDSAQNKLRTIARAAS